MDTTARIVTAWIVGCMIPGVLLIAGNAPLPAIAWSTDQQSWFRVGLALVGLGLVGIVTEVVIVMWRVRRDPIPQVAPHPPSSTPAPELSSPEIEAMRDELAARQRTERRQRQSALRTEAFRLRDEYANLPPTQATPEREMQAWADAENFDRNARTALTAEELAEYDRHVDSAMLSNPEWHRNVAMYFQIKAQRIPFH